MIKRTFSTINKTSIIVTNPAWNKMKEINETQKDQTFLFSATSGGCNGFNYNFSLISKDEYKKIINIDCNKLKPTIIRQNNIKLLVDPKSEFLLLGTTIDYVKEDYSNGVFENKFIFTPNKTLASSCGCGISFTPKKN